MTTFKRIDAENIDISGAFMTLALSDSVTLKLQEQMRKLSEEFGFDVTAENAVAYLLRNVAVIHPNAEMDKACKEFMERGEKINAIKHVREKTHMGLKEAKDYVEQKFQHLIPV